MALYDFHIHSEWSDGDDSIVDIIMAAKKKGLKIIGINDHLSDIKASVPREAEGLNDYLSDIRETAKEIADDLIVLVGLEFGNFALSDIDIKILEQFDYLMFEEIFAPPKIKRLIEWKDKINGAEIGISHARLAWPEQIFDKIISMLEKAGIFLEFNANYTHNFESLNQFHTDHLLSESNVQVSIGSDSHSIKTIGSFEYVVDFLSQICPNYEERLILYNKYYKK